MVTRRRLVAAAALPCRTGAQAGAVRIGVTDEQPGLPSRVTTPSGQRHPWDYQREATIAAEQAFRPLADGARRPAHS